MKSSITYRLFFAMLTAACLSIICMVFIMRWNIDRGFLKYVNALDQARLERLENTLLEHYGEKESWDFLHDGASRLLRVLAVPFFGDDASTPGRVQQEIRARDEADQLIKKDSLLSVESLASKLLRRMEARIVILDGQRKRLYGPDEIPEGVDLRPLLYQNRVIGYLGLVRRTHLSDIQQLRFVRQQELALAMVASVVVLVAAGLSFFLARRLVRPVTALTSATSRMAAGDFDIQVPASSSDEIGILARRFNSLALTLKKNEQARRQLVADVSHELRTPLAVLQGEIEAIRDGIRQPTPQQIGSLHTEVLSLNRLVDDLYQLSLSDLGAMACRKVDLDPAELLRQSIELFRAEFQEKGVALTVDIPQGSHLRLSADPERLHQLFANLLDNSLKYTESGGNLVVRLDGSGRGSITVDFQDSAPGVPEKELGRLFERLYRLEASRSRTTGGAGLGLAICKGIVEAHGGTIEALASPLGGVWIRVIIPTKEG